MKSATRFSRLFLPASPGWQPVCTTSQGRQQQARFLVDATGGAATFARRQGARFVAADRLTAYLQLFENPEGNDPRSLVEAFEQGWWYTAGLPRGLRVVACMTDSDLGKRLGLGEAQGYFRLRSRYYAEEKRWPQSEFWRRRNSPIPGVNAGTG